MKNKIFVAIDTNDIKKWYVISNSKLKNLKIGYKFGLEFMNSKKGKFYIKIKKRDHFC